MRATRAAYEESRRTNIARGRRAALEAYAERNGMTMDELQALRRKELGPAADAYLRRANMPLFARAALPLSDDGVPRLDLSFGPRGTGAPLVERVVMGSAWGCCR
jgi:hypothetical protein